MDQNPYAPPTADLAEVKPPPAPEKAGERVLTEAEAAAEALRRAHQAHEARLRSIGTLMLVGGLNLLLGPMIGMIGVFGVIGSLAAPVIDVEALQGAGLIGGAGLFITGFGALSVRGGMGLRRLDPKHRALYTALVSLWLLSFSFLALVGLWALVLIHSAEGKIVLSPEYAEARRLTPHIRVQTSLVTWLALALLLLGVPLTWFIAVMR
ncbi:hypothetical protein L6R46_29730 [Myxococcota bacterium]|nr:hypothetical protein [Myxococcota bacterium]